MTSLTEINESLDEHYDYIWFNCDWKNWETCEEAINWLEYEFHGLIDPYCDEYLDYDDLDEIKDMCNFNQTVEIREYVAAKYVTLGKPTFYIGDIFVEYIYYYMNETHKENALKKIKDYYNNKN